METPRRTITIADCFGSTPARSWLDSLQHDSVDARVPYIGFSSNVADTAAAFAFEPTFDSRWARLQGAAIGLAGDLVGYAHSRGEYKEIGVEVRSAGTRISDDFVAYKDKVVGTKNDAIDVKSDVSRLVDYQAKASPNTVPNVGNRSSSKGGQVDPPLMQANTFEKASVVRGSRADAAMRIAARRISEAGVESGAALRRRVVDKEISPTEAHRLGRTEADLINSATRTDFLNPGRGPIMLEQQFIDQLQSVSHSEAVRLSMNHIITQNIAKSTTYDRVFTDMMHDAVSSTGARLDSDTFTNVRNQAIALHESALLDSGLDGFRTLSAPFSHADIMAKLPDMIRRGEAQQTYRKFSTVEAARMRMGMAEAAINSGRATSADVRLAKILPNQIDVLLNQRAALKVFDQNMQQAFPGGKQAVMSSEMNSYRYTQAEALHTILKDHPFTFEGPFGHLTDRLLNPKNNKFNDILDFPFTDRAQLGELADLVRGINNNTTTITGIPGGEVVALMLQGTAGATLTQIAYRAEFVKDVYSGNTARLADTLRRPLEAWRTLADLTKSPMMPGSSDLDMGLIVRGGGDKLLSIFEKSKVQFPNDGKAQNLKGGAAIQSIVDQAKPNSVIGRLARQEGLDVPVEWYAYQNAALAQIADAAGAIATPIAQGGISVIANNGVIDVVTHYSPYLDPAYRKGPPSAINIHGFLHSDSLAAGSTGTFVAAAAQFSPLVAQALLNLKVATSDDIRLQVNLHVQSLEGTALGYAVVDRVDDRGRAIEATIVLDDDAAGHGWFIDSTPADDNEFDADGNFSITDPNDNAGTNLFDALTVISHELGHVSGFTTAFDGFASLDVGSHDGRRHIATAEGDLHLDPSGNELDAWQHPSHLMAGTLSPGVRKAIDLATSEVIRTAWATSQTGFDPSSVLGNLVGTQPLGFVALRGNLAEVTAVATGLQDAAFQTNPSDPSPITWQTIGNVAFSDGTATISEDVGMISDLSQTFVVPAGLRSISFTLGGVSMDVSGDFPAEAFEAAILRANDSDSVSGEMVGMNGGDAAFNFQANGSVDFANGVTVSGANTSGDVIDVNREDIRVTLPIPDSMTGEAVTLYFDLIGFGADQSSITLSDVRMNFTVGWQNPIDRFDVDGLGDPSARDALLIINELGRKRVHDPATGNLFEITDEVGPPPFYDVNGDGRISALDALQVINQMGRLSGLLENELPTSWQNPIQAGDVNNNGVVTAADALVVLNELARGSVHDKANGRLHTITETVGPAPFYDVDGNGMVTAQDALRVINTVARQQTVEPESIDEAILSLLDE